LIPDGLGFHPVCFCCGADVDKADGLRVFARRLMVLMAWQPDLSFADEHDYLPPAVVWAALDCPRQFAFMNEGIRTGLLGCIKVEILKSVATTDKMMVGAWCIRVEGKTFCGYGDV
jgi:hypothetical protein